LLKIVVTFAVAAEFDPWRRMLRFEAVRKDGVPAYSARIDDAEVSAVITGIGTRSVGNEFQNIFADSDLCIAAGLAGALRKSYSTGTVLVARAVRTDDTESKVRSHDALLQCANECGATTVDYFFTSNAVVNSSAEKLRLGDIADAVEMESFHVLSQAERCGVPAVAVRAISDAVDTDMPMDFSRVIDERGQIDWMPALGEIVKKPARIPDLVRFGLESSRAAKQLAAFMDRYIKLLIGRTDLQFAKRKRDSAQPQGTFARAEAK
jgi:nucleoside phosphorylase